MDIQIAATHEAAHAVVQWLVGWEPKGIKMTINEGDATNSTAECPCPSVSTIADIRKRLLVLLAGQEATLQKWPESLNNLGDEQDIKRALSQFSGKHGNYSWNVNAGTSHPDPSMECILNEARKKTREIVQSTEIQRTITKVAHDFENALSNANGIANLTGNAIVALCEAEIGEKFRSSNQWADWINGN